MNEERQTFIIPKKPKSKKDNSLTASTFIAVLSLLFTIGSYFKTQRDLRGRHQQEASFDERQKKLNEIVMSITKINEICRAGNNGEIDRKDWQFIKDKEVDFKSVRLVLNKSGFDSVIVSNLDSYSKSLEVLHKTDTDNIELLKHSIIELGENTIKICIHVWQ